MKKKTQKHKARKKANIRKLRVYAFINQQQGNAQLTRNLQKFGVDTIIIIKNWSTPMNIIGMWQMLQKHRLPVYLIDE
ncbi:hypothetical protein BX070DRAFT_259437 [Coemansia spiralis]|nr:hypothetical protein BX070DRAFT_259437 [Coemansia spiralis]